MLTFILEANVTKPTRTGNRWRLEKVGNGRIRGDRRGGNLEWFDC